MISIIYTFNKNSIKSQNLIHIYDFGSYKGFLKNDNFIVYKILHKEMKDTLLYEECEIVELTPFQAFSIEKYEYIEKDEVVYTSNFSIQFKQVLNSSSQLSFQSSSQPSSLQPSSLQPSSLQPSSLQPSSLQPSSLQASSQRLVETLFDQSLLIQIHQNSKKREQIQASLQSETLQLPEQQTLQQPLVRQTSLKLLHNQGRLMIPLGQVLKMQISSLNQSPRR